MIRVRKDIVKRVPLRLQVLECQLQLGLFSTRYYPTRVGAPTLWSKDNTRWFRDSLDWQCSKSRAKNQLRPTCSKLHLHVSVAFDW